MNARHEGLLTRIEDGVVDPTTNLSSLLNMCLVLGGHSRSEKLRDWARKELHGYPDGEPEDFPSYRRVPAVLRLIITNRSGFNPIHRNIRNAQLGPFATKYDTETLFMGHSVSALEALLHRDEEIHLSPPWAPLLCDWLTETGAIDHGESRAVEAFWPTNPATIRGVLGRVRSALADLVAELITETPADQAVPETGVVDRAVQFIVTGERVVIHYTSQQAGAGGVNTAASSGTAPLTVSTGGGTTIGSQHADNGATVVGSQNIGDHGVVAGRDAAVKGDAPKEGWWARLRKRGLFVALFTVVGGIAGVVAAVAAVWELAGLPWPWS